jgi:hypothetical protein
MASMSILDDAIREHLALKRAHGADEGELKKLEDEAFGPPQRPDAVDPFAEAPTEFLTTPEGAEAAPEGGRRMPNIADLQEPPPPRAEPAEEEKAEQAAEATGAGDDAQTAEAPQADAPAVEEQPAMEHETIPEPPAPPVEEPAAEEPPSPASQAEPVAETGPNTEERHAIADQPTQFFDVEAEMAEDSAAAPADDAAPAPPAPVPPLEEDEEDEEFWSEQRLSDELDQALEAPVTEEHEIAPAPEQPSEEHELEQDEALEDDEHDAVEDHVTDEDDRDEDLPQGARRESEQDDDAPPSYESRAGHDDVLEDTPEFLEDAPEDDELWFEQKPPKDFDFDD